MIIFLLFAAILFLASTSIILVMNLHDFKPMLRLADVHVDNQKPLVSICIPARNEQATIERAVKSALRQSHLSTEILILNDRSTDATSEILSNLKKNNPENLFIFNGKPKPENWFGKSWACHQLSEKARGEILFFIDADVWLEAGGVSRAVASLNHFNIDFLTVWPLQKLGSLWEKIVIPLIYYGLFTLLPVRYVYRKPWWLPSSLEQRFSPLFAAACGQCMVFRRAAYQAIGGHQSVRNNIVEDVALAGQIKRNGFSMRMFHGEGAVWCRMYTSVYAMWQGFRKNFLALFGNSLTGFILMAFINFIVFIFPLFALIIGLTENHIWYVILSAIAIIIMIAHRFILARWYQWSRWLSFSHPVGVLWFLALGVQVLKDYIWETPVKWKNREAS